MPTFWQCAVIPCQLSGNAIRDAFVSEIHFFLGRLDLFANFTNRTFPKLGAVDREEVATLFWGFEGIGTMECTHAAATLHRRTRGRSYRQRTWQ